MAKVQEFTESRAYWCISRYTDHEKTKSATLSQIKIKNWGSEAIIAKRSSLDYKCATVSWSCAFLSFFWLIFKIYSPTQLQNKTKDEIPDNKWEPWKDEAKCPRLSYVDALTTPNGEKMDGLVKNANKPILFDLQNNWLKGEQYAHILQNQDHYCQVFNIKKYDLKMHPEQIYVEPHGKYSSLRHQF